MDALVESGLFRDDLFYRLAVGRIELPALRHRREDIPWLVDYFATQVGDSEAPRLPNHVLADWMQRPWPGNIRELRNAVFRYYSLGDLGVPQSNADERSEADATPIAVAPGESEIDAILHQGLPFPRARDRLQQTFEERYVQHLLSQHGGSVQKAAKAAGISARYFQILMARGSK